MTLIAGILCHDGVAIASDRQSTAIAILSLPKPVHVQPTVSSITKVTKIGDDALLAVSGVPAIGTEYERAVRSCHASFAGRPYDFATKKLKEEIRKIINPHLETAQYAASVIGHDRAYVEATCECLLAANFKDGPKLIQILRQGAFDITTPELPLRTIGSGQLHADPFLLFLKNTFWPNRLPSVQEGILAACWTVDYAIEVGAPLVGRDINAYSLAKEGRAIKAKEESAEHIKMHRGFISEVRQRLRELANLRHTTTADANQVPTMGDKK